MEITVSSSASRLKAISVPLVTCSEHVGTRVFEDQISRVETHDVSSSGHVKPVMLVLHLPVVGDHGDGLQQHDGITFIFHISVEIVQYKIMLLATQNSMHM